MDYKKPVVIGSTIRITSPDHTTRDRVTGTVIKHDTYSNVSSVGGVILEQIIEVLWQDGNVGWILKDRVEVINA